MGCYAVLAVLVGCGGAVEHSGRGDEPPVGGSAPNGPPPGQAGSAGAGSTSTAGQASGGTASGGFPNLPDPPPVTGGCDTQVPPVSNECDPFGLNSCLPGSACYPFVDHPEGDGCGTQTYGTVCLPGGVGTQGVRCGDDTGDWCAPGHVCVVGQRAGKRCAKLCQLGSLDQCQDGLVCGDLDVAGYGVCG